MSRPRGLTEPLDTSLGINKENPGKGFTSATGGIANRRPLQSVGNVSRASVGAAVKHEESTDAAFATEDVGDEMPKLEFEALCFSCEDDDYWKQEIQSCCDGLRDLNGQWNMRMKLLSRLRFLLLVRPSRRLPTLSSLNLARPRRNIPDSENSTWP